MASSKRAKFSVTLRWESGSKVHFGLSKDTEFDSKSEMLNENSEPHFLRIYFPLPVSIYGTVFAAFLVSGKPLYWLN
jgi:hypothetical protein